jgi:hypothetical protein
MAQIAWQAPFDQAEVSLLSLPGSIRKAMDRVKHLRQWE